MKGAAEIVLECCSSYLNQNGEKVSLNDGQKQEFINAINSYAMQSLRTISFAYKEVSPSQITGENKDIKQGEYLHEIEKAGGYTLIAIIGIRDVIRSEVPDAVATC
jgi:Ca2+-transporting ATPase